MDHRYGWFLWFLWYEISHDECRTPWLTRISWLFNREKWSYVVLSRAKKTWKRKTCKSSNRKTESRAYAKSIASTKNIRCSNDTIISLVIKSSIHMFDIFKLRISLILHNYVHLKNTNLREQLYLFIFQNFLIEMPVPVSNLLLSRIIANECWNCSDNSIFCFSFY